ARRVYCSHPELQRPQRFPTTQLNPYLTQAKAKASSRTEDHILEAGREPELSRAHLFYRAEPFGNCTIPEAGGYDNKLPIIQPRLNQSKSRQLCRRLLG